MNPLRLPVSSLLQDDEMMVVQDHRLVVSEARSVGALRDR